MRPDLRVTVEAAQAIVECALPGRTVAAVSTIRGGDIAAIFEIAFVEPGPPVVLKIYPDPLHWKMRKEVAVSGLVAGRLGVATPPILLADDTKKVLGLNFVLMTKLDGSILRDLEPALTRGQRVCAHMQIGKVLGQFHRISMDAFGYIGANGIGTPHPTNHAYLSFQFDRKLREFTDRGGAVGLARRVEAHVAGRDRLLRECTRPVLCHNDLHSGNLLAEGAEGAVRLTGVLDFEGALAGDPLMDVAKALYYLGEQDRCAVLEGYGETGRPQPRETLDLYHLYFAIELWCWLAQVGSRQQLDDLASEVERLSGR